MDYILLNIWPGKSTQTHRQYKIILNLNKLGQLGSINEIYL